MLIVALVLGVWVDKRTATRKATESFIALTVSLASVLIYFYRGDRQEPLVIVAVCSYVLGVRQLMLFRKSPRSQLID